MEVKQLRAQEEGSQSSRWLQSGYTLYATMSVGVSYNTLGLTRGGHVQKMSFCRVCQRKLGKYYHK